MIETRVRTTVRYKGLMHEATRRRVFSCLPREGEWIETNVVLFDGVVNSVIHEDNGGILVGFGPRGYDALCVVDDDTMREAGERGWSIECVEAAKEVAA